MGIGTQNRVGKSDSADNKNTKTNITTTYEDAFNADTARGKAARTKYGGDLAKFTTAAKAYNTKQAASKVKNETKVSIKKNPKSTQDMGGAGVLRPKTTSLSDAISSGGGYTNIGSDTRQNADILKTTTNLAESKLKNISRGTYTSSTSEGSIKKGGTLNPVTKTETFGNVTKPGGGTGFIPKGKGSSSERYSYTPEPEGEMLNPTTMAPMKLDPGDYQGYVAPEKTNKQKRQIKRKTRQTARLKKQGDKTDAIMRSQGYNL